MAKKRKISSKSTDPELVKPVESSRKRIRTFDDVADSEDEFHLNQDTVLLDEGSADAKRRRLRLGEEEFLQPSDEEVFDNNEESEDDLQEAEQDSADDDAASESDEEEAWGTSRADLYGADAIETEEQALEEEAEARRLQKKHLQSMNAADYGFDEADWQDEGDSSTQLPSRAVIKEVLPELQLTDSLSEAERLKLLNTRYPEFDLLRKELLSLDETVSSLKQQYESADGSRPNAAAKYHALSAYVGSVAMYFALLTAGTNSKDTASLMPATRLRDHEIMNMLISTRETWQSVQSLPEDIVEIEIPDLEEDAEIDEPLVIPFSKKIDKKQRREEAAMQAKNARIAKRLEQIDADFADMGAQLKHLSQKSRPVRQPQDDDDVGEEGLTAAQAEEKAKRRKSLRFYTSQIAQKANKRTAAGRIAGGDDDVPHRERLRDRQARLNVEAEKRGVKRSDIGEDLGGASDEEDLRQARKIREEVDEDDYYDMVAAKTSQKKADKVALAEARRLAAESGGRVIEEQSLGPDGKRKITYAIEKNKGLTPHRSKDVRNPRVKKRKRYEQKTKKLASMKPTFKGGEGRGGYGGELTGIKSNLVRSVKL